MRPLDNPLADPAPTDTDDAALVARAQAGNRDALEALITRHQPWIYNIARRMVYTKLSTFQGHSSFRTWLYRIVVNHVLTVQKREWDQRWSFEGYASALDGTPELDFPDPNAVPADVRLLVDEARIGCTSGMLLCLDREQRLVYVLGHILGVTDAVGAELLEIGRANFRQKLSRARRDLHNFMEHKCGLVNSANPCRCAKKTQGFIKGGYVDPKKLIFASAHVTRVREVVDRTCEEMTALDDAYAEIHRDHPFHTPPDFVASLRELMNRAEFQSILEPPKP